MSMFLTGDANTPAMPMTEAEVNHLRRLLAWMRCEWTLDEDMQRGYLLGASEGVAHGFATPEQAGALVQEKAEQINRCPAYVRQAVKMLTKALRKHERNCGIVEAEDGTLNRYCPVCYAAGPCQHSHTMHIRVQSGSA